MHIHNAASMERTLFRKPTHADKYLKFQSHYPLVHKRSVMRTLKVWNNQYSLQWPLNGRDGVSNHQHHHCLPNLLLRRRSKKTSKLRVTGLGAENSLVTGEFPAHMSSHAEDASLPLDDVIMWPPTTTRRQKAVAYVCEFLRAINYTHHVKLTDII